MVRQEDIAKELNISRATVSRALNGDKISEKTKQKVLETAKKLGYIQNNAATSLASKKDKVVEAFLGTSIVGGYFEEMQKGIKEILEIRSGYKFNINLNYVDINKDKNQAREQLKQFYKVMENKNKQVDGVILSSFSQENLDIIKKECDKLNIPLITLDNPFKRDDVCHVGPDYYKIGEITASLIANLIRKKGNILAITFDEGYGLNNSRIEGFYDKLKEYKNINLDDVQINYISKEKYKSVILESFEKKKYDAVYATFRTEYIPDIIKEIDNEIVIVANDINEKIEGYMKKDMINSCVYQRPYYQGLVVANNFFKYFYNNSEYKKEHIETGIDILFKENMSIIKNYI